MLCNFSQTTTNLLFLLEWGLLLVVFGANSILKGC